jgi:hypothetical protein
MTARRVIAISLLTTTLLASAPAWAQTQPADNASGGDDIIVTAQKRSESL